MTKIDDEDFENSTKCWIRDNFYIDCDVKVKDRCHITGKYRGFAHEIPVLFRNLKNLIHILLCKN